LLSLLSEVKFVARIRAQCSVERPLPLRNLIPRRLVSNVRNQNQFGNSPDLAARDAIEFDQPLRVRFMGGQEVALAVPVELHGGPQAQTPEVL
jgi:hypothetical protein